MELYWRETRKGFNLVVKDGDEESRVGGVRGRKGGVTGVAERGGKGRSGIGRRGGGPAGRPTRTAWGSLTRRAS